jgi:AraC family transcriptional regulator
MSKLSTSAVRPSKSLNERAAQPLRSHWFKQLQIFNLVQPPNEYEVAFTHNMLCVQMHTNWQSLHQVRRFAGKAYEHSYYPFNFYLLPAQMPAFFSWNEMDESVEFAIEPSVLEQIAIENDCLHPNQVELRPVIYQTDTTLIFLAKSFKEELQNNALGGKLYGESLANLLLIHLLRYYCAFTPIFRQTQNGLSAHKLRQAIDYIQSHLADDVSLAAIAHELGMSPYYFCRLFKQSTGIAPHQYLTQQRIYRTKELLKQSQLSISEIALRCGFSDQAHFTKQFRQLIGIPPRAYRNSL